MKATFEQSVEPTEVATSCLTGSGDVVQQTTGHGLVVCESNVVQVSRLY